MVGSLVVALVVQVGLVGKYLSCMEVAGAVVARDRMWRRLSKSQVADGVLCCGGVVGQYG